MVDLNLEKLKEEQKKLALKIILKDEFEGYSTIAGVDQLAMGNQIICGIVVIDAKTMAIVEKKYAVLETKIPYVAGFLAYRESPAIIEAYNKLNNKPDILIVKGNGILHPRRIGLASHIGLLLNKPTIGVAKKPLYGIVRGDSIYIDKEAVGKKVKIKETGNPVVVSPGHLISLKTSIEIVKKFAEEPYKVPLPLALAHKYANKVKQKLEAKQTSSTPAP
ncbi:MAG: endonuclease V [Candidatus Woesearchaeota archaeon]